MADNGSVIAGVDMGSTLTKVVWENKDGFQYRSTAEVSIEDIEGELLRDGVSRLHKLGIGSRKELQGFDMIHQPGDPIENELLFQCSGAQRLVDVDNFLLVSIGTGTSYVSVRTNPLNKKRQVQRFPLGNSHGGGYIKGLGAMLGGDLEEVANAKGNPLDLLVKDVLPSKKHSPEGKIVVASMGKGSSDAALGDKYASVVNDVAISIVRDVMLMDMTYDFSGHHNVVYVGSTINRFPQLRHTLDTYTHLIGKHAIIPERGEYALAIGAYHMDDNTMLMDNVHKAPKGSMLAKAKGIVKMLRGK